MNAHSKNTFLETPSWSITHLDETTSTNDFARNLTPWSAVIANRQTHGRGRHGRPFACTDGGLWLSAVVPTPGGAQQWLGFPLAIGWALLQFLQTLPGGLPTARLRWPNDILVENRKLAGILLEQPDESRCIVGIGLNARNNPTRNHPELASIAIQLADCIYPPLLPSLEELADGTLQAIRTAWLRFSSGGLPSLKNEINACWGKQYPIRLTLADGSAVEGTMLGIDDSGAILLQLPDSIIAYPAHHVTLLTEILPEKS